MQVCVIDFKNIIGAQNVMLNIIEKFNEYYTNKEKI